jgi:hypothetical protein
MDALSGAFTVLTIKENLDDRSSTLPLVGEGDIFYPFLLEPNKARFLELLNDISTELAQDLQSLQKYPVCITALRSALRILPIRSNYNFRMLAFFMRYRMTYVCGNRTKFSILRLTKLFTGHLVVFMHPLGSSGVLEALWCARFTGRFYCCTRGTLVSPYNQHFQQFSCQMEATECRD